MAFINKGMNAANAGTHKNTQSGGVHMSLNTAVFHRLDGRTDPVLGKHIGFADFTFFNIVKGFKIMNLTCNFHF
jgi:hypothetical protein